VTVDWAHRESAHARMRVLVKLRKYGYPPGPYRPKVMVSWRPLRA